MKKKIEFSDFFESTASVLGWTLTWAIMMFGWMAVGQPLTNAATQGRVHLQLEDLKKLIHLDSRNPSAEGVGAWNVSGLVQDELGADATFEVRLTLSEKARLARKVAQLENRSEKQIAAIEKEYADAISSTKAKRKDLQVKKLNAATANNESDTSKRIFENVLEEANYAALRDAKIAAIKEQNVVTLVVRENVDGARRIESIVAGDALLWGRKTSAIAYNKN